MFLVKLFFTTKKSYWKKKFSKLLRYKQLSLCCYPPEIIWVKGWGKLWYRRVKDDILEVEDGEGECDKTKKIPLYNGARIHIQKYFKLLLISTSLILKL